MSKHVKSTPAATSFTLVHPHGLPCLHKPDGTVWTCDPDSEPINIGTYDKASNILKLATDVDDRLTARVASWRAKQSPRVRTERLTAYRAFMRKSKAATTGGKQAAGRAAGTGEGDAAEDNCDEE
jgi:hypothetical protein